MVDESKTPDVRVPDELQVGETQKVPLTIKCRADIHPGMVSGYGQAVQFMAIWCKIHEPREGSEGIPFDVVMRDFTENVTRCLVGETKGSA